MLKFSGKNSERYSKEIRDLVTISEVIVLKVNRKIKNSAYRNGRLSSHRNITSSIAFGTSLENRVE